MLLIVGVVVWLSAIATEYNMNFRYFDDGQIPPPCMIEREFSAYNLLFVAFPLALIMVAEVHIANSIGAEGFTPMLEIFLILGITAYEKYIRMHPPFCILAGIAHTLNCFNVSIVCGLIAGLPLASIGVLAIICHVVYCPHENAQHPNTHTSLLFWLLDTWFIVSRVALLYAEPTAHVDHFWFDAIGATVLAVILAATAAVVTRAGV